MGNVIRLGIARIGLTVNQWRTNRRLSKKTIVILILGLQRAGKSTIALRLWKLKKTLPDPTYVQTKGFNTYEIRKKKLTVRLHDLGGHGSIRELWQHYYADAHGIVFVVDSSKQEEGAEAGAVIAEVLRDERMERKPVLVLLNKQDLPDAGSEIDLTNKMDLATTVNSLRCVTRVDVCAATDLKDEGMYLGFRWLQSFIELHYAEIDGRVQHDSAIEREKEKVKFDLRRSEAKRAREQTSVNPRTPRAKSADNRVVELGGTNQVYVDDDGIQQVQKPPEVNSMDGDSESALAVAAAKKLNDNDMLDTTRLSPEGAADSTEDLSNMDTINSNTDVANKDDNVAVKTNNINNNNNSRPATQRINRSANRTDDPRNNHHPRKGIDNQAYEPNEDDQETTFTRSGRRYRNHILDTRFSTSKLPVRSSAISIRSNSTETDIELPGEIILVTTKAEVHKSQEMIDEYNSNPNYNYENIERNASPISYISGHISHKTSQESIASAVLVNQDSIHESKDNSRASSASFIINKDNAQHAKPTTAKATPLQKLVNIKSRNKTAPLSDDTELNDQLNGNVIHTKKEDSATNKRSSQTLKTENI